MFVTHVTFNLSGIDEKAYQGAVKDLAPSYANVPGLVSKVWIKQSDKGVYGGIYYWDSEASYDKYMSSDLYKAVSTHPNLINFNTACYNDVVEGTSVTKGVCKL
ncbi:MAG TPA: YdhR family protein [Burkholderiaceae bacterium]|mgnify:CR=1 FL=1|nr:YdhR family protein [Burkholderiaceae bacterium]